MINKSVLIAVSAVGLIACRSARANEVKTPCTAMNQVWVTQNLGSGEYEIKYAWQYGMRPGVAILKPLKPFTRSGAVGAMFLKRVAKRTVTLSNGFTTKVDLLQQCSPSDLPKPKYAAFGWHRSDTGECKPSSDWGLDADGFSKRGKVISKTASTLAVEYIEDDNSKVRVYFGTTKAACEAISVPVEKPDTGIPPAQD